MANLSQSEVEIGKTGLRIAIDNFGLVPHSNENHAWKQAIEVDSLFVNDIEKVFFLCVDCDSYIKCENSKHAAYVRCFGTGEGHCANCSWGHE